MNYELSKQLKDVGFPQEETKDSDLIISLYQEKEGLEKVHIPDLLEIIQKCGNDFKSLRLDRGMWIADAATWMQLPSITGGDPEIVMAKLLLSML